MVRDEARPEPERRLQECVEESGNRNQFVRLWELRKIAGLGGSTICKMINEGRFPRPVKLGVRASAWRMKEVLRWQDTLGEQGVGRTALARLVDIADKRGYAWVGA